MIQRIFASSSLATAHCVIFFSGIVVSFIFIDYYHAISSYKNGFSSRFATITSKILVLFVPKRQMVVSFNTKYNNNSNTEGKNDLKLKTSSTRLFESKFLYNPFLQEIKKKLTEIKAHLPPKKH